MKRLNKTLNDYSSRLEAFGVNKETDKITLLTKLRDCDVSKGKYTRFLLECYLDKTIRDEDLSGALESTVGKTISLFHKNKNKLPEKDRSLNRYKTVGEIWKNVRQFGNEKSAHELKKEHRDKINSQTKFIVNSDYKVLSPLTKESAQFWGRGTRWCTSAKENNAFDEYNEEASLYIVIFPNGDKFQLWRNDNKDHNQILFDRFEAMDEADDEVDAEFIIDKWNYFKELYDILPLYYIPQEKLTYEKCLKEVEKDGDDLEYVPEKFKTYDLCMDAVKNNGGALKFVPESIKDYNLCFEAVKKGVLVLPSVPEKFKTYELCLEAVKKNGRLLQYVPDEFKDYNLCFEAVKNYGSALTHVPKKIIDYNLCLETIKNNGWLLQLVPDEFKTYELCLNAVKNNGQALEFVPEKFKNYNLHLETIKNNGWVLQLVPDEFKTYELCLEAVKDYRWALKEVPEDIVDYNICLEAVKNSGLALRFVPENIIDYDLCLEAVRGCGWSLKKVPEKFLTKEMFDIVINNAITCERKKELMKEKEEFMKKRKIKH